MRPRWPEGMPTPRWAQSNDSLASHNSLWRAAVYFLVCVAVYECLVLSYPAAAPSRTNNPLYNRLKPHGVNIGGHKDNEAATQPIASGRILVTGGGGNVGKHLVRRLLTSKTPTTILDTIFYPDELSSRTSDSRALLQVHIGDIRNSTAVASALTPDIVGVVHLAAVSRVGWCLQNEKDCMDVNERGTKLVLEALSKLNEHDNGRRWFILASSREVYGDAPVDAAPFLEDDEKKPANTYGRSKLAAERVVERYIADWASEDSPSFGGMHTVALRLSNVYGGIYDHLERLVPSITTQALSHQVIQIAGGQQDFDMLHIDDCIEAFVLAITHLTGMSRNTWSLPYFSSTPFSFEAFNVASGFSAKVAVLVDTITGLTRSQSPIRYLSADNRYPNVYRGSVAKAQKVLGFRARIDIQEGLLAFVKAHIQHASESLSRQIQTTCPSPTSTARRSNTDLSKLDGCKAHVELDLQGEFVGLAPPHSQNKGVGYWTIKPLDAKEDPVRTLIISASSSVWPSKRSHGRSSELKTLVRLHGWWEETWNGGQSSFLGMWRNTDIAPTPESFTVDQIFDKNLTQSVNGRHPIVDWELQANPDHAEGTLRLVVPGTNPPLQLITPPFAGANFSLGIVDDEAENSWNVRLTPTCCPAMAPWPYSADDPVEWSIQYQKTSLARPFLASPSKTFCDRLTRAQRKLESDLVALSLLDANRSDLPSRKLSELPTRWAHADLAACSNLCDDGFPSICVDTGDCQCVLSSCVPRKRFPFPEHAFKNQTSFPPPASPRFWSLAQRVAQRSWKSALRPQVASYLSTHPRFPKIHVNALTPFDTTWLETTKAPDGGKFDPDKLRDGHCYSADGQLRKGLFRLGNVPERESEMRFIMHYQGRANSDGIIDKAYDWIRQSTPGFDASKVIMPFTYDFGPCLIFDWTAWRMREQMGLNVRPEVKFTTAWSVMGDLNIPCYRPHQDVVIPPRTCLTPKLFSTFRTVSSVRPARSRNVIATFSGSRWGTGFLDRQRVECVRAGWHDEDIRKSPRRLRGLEHGPILRAVWGGPGPYRDYIDLLGHTIFCPVPAGTAGWAPRMVDAMYAGCIPVLIGHVTIPPFFDIFDWSKFSVRIEPSEISHLEDILIARYSIDDIEDMQTNLMLVRDAFVYPLDEMGDDEAQGVVLGGEDEARRGPLFWALHATRMRMLTKWPVDEGFDRP